MAARRRAEGGLVVQFQCGHVVCDGVAKKLIALTVTGGCRPPAPLLSRRPLMHALEIDDLVKRYPTGTEALKGVSLEIEEGEFFGLLGPNGAGKSTLIHCTTGLAQPTSGDDPRLRPRRRRTTTGRRAWRSGSRRRSSTSTGS